MLQGSLDNFGLDEVLGLLADTAKTGRMRITGDRGSGSLWLASGKLVGSEASRVERGRPADETMFELLRFNTGNFSFNMDETPTEPTEDRAVGGVLEAAFERLAQWRDIEAVVPSLAHVIAPVSTLPTPEVTITSGEWDLLMAIGAGTEVGSICDHFGLGEVEGSRQVKLLVERSLITIEAPTVSVAAAAIPVVAEPAPTDSDDFGLAPAGLTTDDPIDPATINSATTVGAFDAAPAPVPAPSPAPEASASSERFGVDAIGETPSAIPTESGFLDPAERAWSHLAEAEADAEADTDAADSSEADDQTEATSFQAPAFEAAFESSAFDSPAPEHDEAADFEASAFDAPSEDAAVSELPAFDTDEFSFRSDPPPPSLDQRSTDRTQLRRVSDIVPPPPPAPPAAFDQFDAPAPPPPAPPSPADLVGSERVDGAEARRLLAGRGADRFDAVAEEVEEEDDGSLLMQYLRDES